MSRRDPPAFLHEGQRRRPDLQKELRSRFGEQFGPTISRNVDLQPAVLVGHGDHAMGERLSGSRGENEGGLGITLSVRNPWMRAIVHALGSRGTDWMEKPRIGRVIRR
jgi:hypothetical protein